MSWEKFKDVKVKHKQKTLKQRFSATADVLSYRRCPRQYGFESEKGFVPSLPSQIFVGTIIHEVLDRAHGYFKGKRDPNTKNKIPSDDDIEAFFNEVENALRAQGMRVPGKVKDFSLRILKNFNRIEGANLYPKVVDTEHRLQADREDYILYGVVDVLVSGVNEAGEPRVEIWDYKGSHRPGKDDAGLARMKDYKFQMQVYANLYKLRNLVYPSKAVIYFVGELADSVDKRPDNAMMEIELDEDMISTALNEFDSTVKQIVSSTENNYWPPADKGHETAGKETCSICDERWSCPIESKNYPKRYLGQGE